MRLFAVRVIVPKNKNVTDFDVVTELIEADFVGNTGMGASGDLCFWINEVQANGRPHNVLSSSFKEGSWLYFTEIFQNGSEYIEKEVDHEPTPKTIDL